MERQQTQRDWAAWHKEYDDPHSPLSRRLTLVRRRIAEILDAAPAGPVRTVSLCAGQGRDLIGAAAGHPRAADVRARLVELDPENVRAAREAALSLGLPGITAVAADASVTDAYLGAVPADLVLVCGVFGNITDADIRRTVSLLPRLCAPGAHVVWTRNRVPPDPTPDICRWFGEHGFQACWLSPPEAGVYGVGVHRFTGTPLPLEPGVRMFTFVGYDELRDGAPWPS
ncbi:class I SAM-dependent methyltransferase [Actinomadura kijaniata]|uniref:class I SAM-dependent methyltransferase n=1 Tax=Actinomadura kijaniata TaxID=46161 RepID=UPI00083404AC|nr:class I SAM-dependent methyltransferase [Actinomadura kijaniata]